MKAFYLVKNGPSDKAFELRETETPKPGPGEVLVRSEAFGLNFADVMARLGLYQDCPPLPTVIGYENVGRIAEVGEGVTDVKPGQRVVAFTRFGGYADHVITDARAVAVIPEDMDAGVANALATQYVTAYYAAEHSMSLMPGDHVLIHAAAGGVGTALVQMAKNKGCVIFGTAGSAEKLDYLREQGVTYPINYRSTDFAKEIKKLGFEKKIDVVFDPVGGSSFKKGVDLMNSGGRMCCYGASSMTDAQGNPFKTLGVAAGFGLWSPIILMMRSISFIGVNMLRIADNKPDLLTHCMNEVVRMTAEGILEPTVGGEFTYDKLAKAHDFLASRKSIGKVVVNW